jgi:hypothetical protein
MPTETKPTIELEAHPDELITRVRAEPSIRFALSTEGEVVAGLVSVRELRLLEQLDRERAHDWARLREIRKKYFSDVSPDELLREALKAQEAGREEARNAASKLAAKAS